MHCAESFCYFGLPLRGLAAQKLSSFFHQIYSPLFERLGQFRSVMPVWLGGRAWRNDENAKQGKISQGTKAGNNGSAREYVTDASSRTTNQQLAATAVC